MKRPAGSFSWSAFDPNRWDHYTHAGQQVRFYRVSPDMISGAAFFGHQPIRRRRARLIYRVSAWLGRLFA